MPLITEASAVRLVTERPPLCVCKGGGGTLVRGRNRCSAWASVGVRVKCNWPFQKKTPVRFSSVHTGSKNNMECNLCLLCILDYAPWLSFIIQGSMSHYGMHTMSSALKSFNLTMPIWFAGELVSLRWAVPAAINTPLWTAPVYSDTSTHSGLLWYLRVNVHRYSPAAWSPNAIFSPRWSYTIGVCSIFIAPTAVRAHEYRTF